MHSHACLLLCCRLAAEFYAALAAGSWLEVLPTATHTSFSNIPNGVCGKGSTSPQVSDAWAAATHGLLLLDALLSCATRCYCCTDRRAAGGHRVDGVDGEELPQRGEARIASVHMAPADAAAACTQHECSHAHARSLPAFLLCVGGCLVRLQPMGAFLAWAQQQGPVMEFSVKA